MRFEEPKVTPQKYLNLYNQSQEKIKNEQIISNSLLKSLIKELRNNGTDFLVDFVVVIVLVLSADVLCFDLVTVQINTDNKAIIINTKLPINNIFFSSCSNKDFIYIHLMIILPYIYLFFIFI